MCGHLNGWSVTANPLPLSILSELEVVKLNIQAALGWGWKWLVGGGAVVAKGGISVQRGMSPWAQLWAEEGPCRSNS